MSINKVQLKSGSVLLDVTDVETTSANVLQGVTFIDNAGNKGVGTYVPPPTPSGDNKLNQVLRKTVTSIDENDLQNVTEIPAYAFKECQLLESVSIPIETTNIGMMCFSGCTSLSQISFPGLETVQMEAFRYCPFETLDARQTALFRIDDSAFRDCNALQTVYLPSTVLRIGRRAFRDCTSLTSVYIEAITPPNISDGQVFQNDTALEAIYVPAEALLDYQNDQYWAEYASILQPMSN